MTDEPTDDAAILAIVDRLEPLAKAATPGKRIYAIFTKPNGDPIASVDDVAETVVHSARESVRAELYGVTNGVPDENGREEIICYTGNGPRSPNNAAFIGALEPGIVLSLVAAVRRLVGRVAELKGERDELRSTLDKIEQIQEGETTRYLVHASVASAEQIDERTGNSIKACSHLTDDQLKTAAFATWEGLFAFKQKCEAERDAARAEVARLISCVITVSKENTDEWMEYIPGEINKAAEFLGETDRAIYDKRRGDLRIVRGGCGTLTPDPGA